MNNSRNALQEEMLRGAEILEQEARENGMRFDGYRNMMNKYGTRKDSSERYSFHADAMTMDSKLTEAYEANGIFTKIIDRPAEEALKRGFDLGIKDQEIMKFIENKLDALDWEQQAALAIKWTRLYGGALMVMLVDDGQTLDQPLDWNNVRSIDEIKVYERPLVQPDYHSIYRSVGYDHDRAVKAKFGSPQYFTVNSIYGTFKVHESRCLPFRNGILPENSLNTQYRFWGIPEYYRIKKEIQETYTAHGDGTKLLDRCVQAIYKMKGLGNRMLTDEGETQVLKRLDAIDMARGILNTIIIDADGEDYDFKQMQLGGVRDIIDSTCNMLSAVTDIPQTILFGRSPAGENSTGESDMENYYNMVERIQKMNLKANGRTIIELILKEGLVSGEISQKPDYKIGFEKLWSLSEKEQAELDKLKADTEFVKAQTAQIYMDAQVLTSSEVRKGLAQNDTFYVEDLLEEDDEINFGDEETDAILSAIENGTEDTTLATPEDNEQDSNSPLMRRPDTPSQLKAQNKALGLDDEEEPQKSEAEEFIEELEEEIEEENKTPVEQFIEELENETNDTGSIPTLEDLKNATPKDLDVGVGVLVVKDGKILIAKRSDGMGWCGPGGHIHESEDIEQSAKRETYEEFDIIPTQLIPMDGCTIALDGKQVCNQFLCTEYEGEPQADEDEMSDARFVSLEELEAYPLFKPFREVVELFLQAVKTDSDCA